MKILFLTIGRMESIEAHSIYPDLLREFRDHGHEVYIVSPRERRTGLCTEVVETPHVKNLYVQIGNITKCGFIEKGLSTVRIGSQFKKAVRTHFGGIDFDLIMYSTPPITLVGAVKSLKKHGGAETYLLLKDIFPQNAVDLGLMSEKGLKSPIYRYFRSKEKKLYKVSDHIGCMSRANVDYLLRHDPEVPADKVSICPNCVDPVDMRLSAPDKAEVRRRYGIPTDKTVYVYGGNLGKPQDVPFVIECLKACRDIPGAFFVVAGGGTDRHYLEEYIAREAPDHVRLLGALPKDEYDRMIACCDAGLIFLDHRFTIPNFPSRLLAYLQAGLPVLACTDAHTDVSEVIEEGGLGWWCESTEAAQFCARIRSITPSEIAERSARTYAYLTEHYTARLSYEAIMRSLSCEC